MKYLHIRNRVPVKDETIYVVMSNTLIDNQNCNVKGKICCTITKNSSDIIVSPGYSKTYFKDIFCAKLCDKKERCHKKNWNDSCFVNSLENLDYNKIHITRHNTVLHYTDESRKLGKIRWERTALSQISEYEFIAGYSFSPQILFSHIAKDYSKNKENEIILLIPNGSEFFNIYILINPKNNNQLFEDLKKYNFEIAKYEYEEYDIVVVVETVNGINQNVVTGFTNMYIETHKNYGIGNFIPIEF